jgi:hypothetical protein
MATLAHVKVIFQLAGLSERASIGVDFESNLAISALQLNGLLTSASDGWKSFMETRFPASSNVVKLSGFTYQITGGQREILFGPVEIPHVGAGLGGGTALPPQNSIVVTHRTDLSSRRTRGRVYLPPSRTTDVQSDGTIQELYRGNLQTSYDNWIVGIQNSAGAPQTYTHVVASLTAGTVRAVTARQVNNRVDTQRRRLPK